MNAYGYCRYSSDLQNEASIEQQKNELKEYAIKNNIRILNFYCDEAKSGTKDTRENFQCMINDCKKKLVDCILVWKTDRFARNAQDSLFYKMRLEKLGIKIISITQPIDSTTPEGQLMYTLLAGMDEYYSKNLASNVKRALKMNAQSCQFNGGISPLGYTIIDKKYVVNERERPIIEKIFNWYINGLGVLEIASKLNLEGYKTRKGKPFGKNSVYDIISNEKYTGTYIFNKGTKNNHRMQNENEIRIDDGIPPIISKEVYKKAMEMRTKNKQRPAAQSAKNVYILSGKIVCGKCGASYCGQTTSKTKGEKTYRKGWYFCSNRNSLNKCDNHRIEQDLIEQFVIDALIAKIMNGKSMETIIENIKIQYANLTDKTEIENKKARLKEIQSECDSIVENIGKFCNDRILQRLQSLESTEKELIEQIEFLENASGANIEVEKIVDVLQKDIKDLKTKSKQELKILINKYIKRIVIYADKFSIEYTFSDIIDSRNLNDIQPVATRQIYDFFEIGLIMKKRCY